MNESAEGDQRRRRTPKKVKKLSNDELFYDPNMDDEDEKWMKRRRMEYHNGEVGLHNGGWVTLSSCTVKGRQSYLAFKCSESITGVREKEEKQT